MPEDLDKVLTTRKEVISNGAQQRRNKPGPQGTQTKPGQSRGQKRKRGSASKRRHADSGTTTSSTPRRSTRVPRPTERALVRRCLFHPSRCDVLSVSQAHQDEDTDTEYVDDGAREQEEDIFPSDEEVTNGALPSLLHPDDVSNFMKLTRALQILLAGRITDAKIEEADELIRSYCTELIEVSSAIILMHSSHI